MKLPHALRLWRGRPARGRGSVSLPQNHTVEAFPHYRFEAFVPKAPWSAAAKLPPWNSGKKGGSFAAALQGASRIFMVSGCPCLYADFRMDGSKCNSLGPSFHIVKATDPPNTFISLH